MTDNPGWASPSSSSEDAPDQAAPHEPVGGTSAPPPEGQADPASPESPASGDSDPDRDPDDRDPDATAPSDAPPNWSKQQPPRADWTTPGWGGQPPGGPAGPGGPGGFGGFGPGGPGGPGGGGQQPPPGWGGTPGWGGQQPPPHQGWGQAPTWGRPPAAKPGVIPLRPLGVGEILDGAVSTMRAHWRTVLGVSLAVALITQTVSTAVTWWAFNGFESDIDALEADPDPSIGEVMSVFTGMFAGIGVAQIITILGTLIVTAMLTMVVSRSVLGRPVTAADAWRDARPRLLKLLGLTLLMPLIALAIIAVACAPGIVALVAGSDALGATLTILGLLAGFCVAVWVVVRLSLASPALMLEKQGVFRSMARSSKLVRGSWWRVFGILLLTAIITFIISSIVQTPFTVLSFMVGGDSMGSLLSGDSSGSLGLPALIVTAIGAAIGMTISFPISAGVTVLLYIDQRIRREALDLDLARAAGVPGYDAPAPAQSPADTPAPGN